MLVSLATKASRMGFRDSGVGSREPAEAAPDSVDHRRNSLVKSSWRTAVWANPGSHPPNLWSFLLPALNSRTAGHPGLQPTGTCASCARRRTATEAIG